MSTSARDGVTRRQRGFTLAGIAASSVVAAALWFVLLEWLPDPAASDRLELAIGCIAVAALLALVAGVEAVAHERLVTPAIDPLAEFVTPRLQVNFRYLQNTLEQFVVFAAGLLLLSFYASAKILVIATIVWVLARWAFWIGYHKSPLLRAIGAPGMMQSMLVLLYGVYRFGSDMYGESLGIALLLLFAVIETVLFWAVKRPA